MSRTVTQFLLSAGADRMDVGDADHVNLTKVTKEVVKFLRPFALMNGAEITYVSDHPHQNLRGTYEGIELALSNLIQNAVFHGGAGPISDTGTGLPSVVNETMLNRSGAALRRPKAALAWVSQLSNASNGRMARA